LDDCKEAGWSTGFIGNNETILLLIREKSPITIQIKVAMRKDNDISKIYVIYFVWL